MDVGKTLLDGNSIIIKIIKTAQPQYQKKSIIQEERRSLYNMPRYVIFVKINNNLENFITMYIDVDF